MYLTFCRKQCLAELEKSSCDFENSQLLSYFEKLKKTWFLHACRYLKNCNEFLRLKYLYMRLQNLYILKQIVNLQWSNNKVIHTSQLNYPLCFQMFMAPWKSLTPQVLLLEQKSYLLYINLCYQNLGYKIQTTILKNRMQSTLDAIIGENQSAAIKN